LITEAAGILARHKGLKSAPKLGSQLQKAIDPLYNRGKAKWDEAQALIAALSQGDKDKLWVAQIRNVNAKGYDELICKKDYVKPAVVAPASNSPVVSVPSEITPPSSEITPPTIPNDSVVDSITPPAPCNDVNMTPVEVTPDSNNTDPVLPPTGADQTPEEITPESPLVDGDSMQQ